MVHNLAGNENRLFAALNGLRSISEAGYQMHDASWFKPTRDVFHWASAFGAGLMISPLYRTEPVRVQGGCGAVEMVLDFAW